MKTLGVRRAGSFGGGAPDQVLLLFFLITLGLELSDTKVYGPTRSAAERSAAERGGNNLKSFKDFSLKAKARIWS